VNDTPELAIAAACTQPAIAALALLCSSLLFSSAEELSLGTWVVAGFETWSLGPKTRGDENNEGLLACHRDPDWLSAVQSMAHLVQIRVRLSGSLFLAFSYPIFSLAYSIRFFFFFFFFLWRNLITLCQKNKSCAFLPSIKEFVLKKWAKVTIIF
jgi:hypothetical protein